MNTTSIYSYQFTSLNGNEINLSQFQGKKILLVNIASDADSAASQIPALQQLYTQYQSNLVIVGFPSNDFGNESRNNNDLKLLMANTYNVTFQVSVLTGVKDTSSNTHPIFQWLQKESENGVINAKVRESFDKFLIDSDGTLVGIFSDKVYPLSPQIINAITQ